MSVAWPFVIQETTGKAPRTIELRGTSLPFRDPGVNWPGEQRVNINWYPGNPQATAQVIGPIYKSTTIRGRWSDSRFRLGGGGIIPGFASGTIVSLDGPNPNANAPILRNFPPIGIAGQALGPDVAGVQGRTFSSNANVPGNVAFASRARTLVDAVELVRLSGQRLRVQWGSIVRYGFLVNFEPVFRREEDVFWEMTFEWIGDSIADLKIVKKEPFDPLGLLQKVINSLQDFVDTLVRARSYLRGRQTQITQAITKLGSLLSQITEQLSSFAQLLVFPAQVIGTVRDQLRGIVAAANELVIELRSVPVAYSAISGGGTQADAGLAAEYGAAIIRAARILGASIAQQANQLDDQVTGDVLAIVVSNGVQTLRDLASKFYGDPNKWTAIAEFNGFDSVIVPAGTKIRIPRV